jgi:eukaryotic-like serine/threonine-protein kinase
VKTCPLCSTEYPDDLRFCPNDGQTLRSSSPGQDLVGQVLADRYHVVKKLGEGGMGQVYLAEHVKMGRKSAIKVLNPSLVYDTDAVARFNREAANASRISHPSVCAIYDFGETPEGVIYLAMEFIEGEPLTDVLEREGALPVPRAAAIVVQTAEALQAAHDLGIVHRDLKPDNIMITRARDGTDAVKVVDFGIAKLVGNDASQEVTKTGLVIGTPEFMSPEQLSGDKLDGRSDIYSLGLVFFKMLTGRPAFEAGTVQETMIQRLTEEPLKLAAARPDLRFPPGLQGTLDSALARSPVERYQSAAKFANDVASVTGLMRRSSPTPMPVTRGDAEDRTRLLDSRAVAALSLPRRTPVPPVKRRSLVPVIVGAGLVLGAGGAAMMVFGRGRRADNAARLDTMRGAPPPAAVDSTSRAAAPPPPPPRAADSRTARRPSGRDAGATHRAPPPPPPPAPPTVVVSEVQVRRTLESTALDLAAGTITAKAARDTAGFYYAMTALPKVYRAAAAKIVCDSYMSENARSTALQWCQGALILAPDNTTYQKLVRLLKGDSQP